MSSTSAMLTEFGLLNRDQTVQAQKRALRDILRANEDLRKYSFISELSDEDIYSSVGEIGAQQGWTPPQQQAKILELQTSRDDTKRRLANLNIDRGTEDYFQKLVGEIRGTTAPSDRAPIPATAQKPAPTLAPQKEGGFWTKHPVWATALAPIDLFATGSDVLQGAMAGGVERQAADRQPLSPEDWAALDAGKASKRSFGGPSNPDLKKQLETFGTAFVRGLESGAAHTFTAERPMFINELQKVNEHYLQGANEETTRRFTSKLLTKDTQGVLFGADSDLEQVAAEVLVKAKQQWETQNTPGYAEQWGLLTAKEQQEIKDQLTVKAFNALKAEQKQAIGLRDQLYDKALSNDDAGVLLKHPYISQFLAELSGGDIGGAFYQTGKAALTGSKAYKAVTASPTLRSNVGKVVRHMPEAWFYNKAATVADIEKPMVTMEEVPSINKPTAPVITEAKTAEKQLAFPFAQDAEVKVDDLVEQAPVPDLHQELTGGAPKAILYEGEPLSLSAAEDQLRYLEEQKARNLFLQQGQTAAYEQHKKLKARLDAAAKIEEEAAHTARVLHTKASKFLDDRDVTNVIPLDKTKQNTEAAALLAEYDAADAAHKATLPAKQQIEKEYADFMQQHTGENYAFLGLKDTPTTSNFDKPIAELKEQIRTHKNSVSPPFVSVPERMRYATDRGEVARESMARMGTTYRAAANPSPRSPEYLKDLSGFVKEKLKLSTPELDMLHAAANDAHPEHAAALAQIQNNPKMLAKLNQLNEITSETYDLSAQHGLMNYVDEEGVLRKREPRQYYTPQKMLSAKAHDAALDDVQRAGFGSSFDTARAAIKNNDARVSMLSEDTRKFLEATDPGEGSPFAVGQVQAKTGSELGRVENALPWERDVRMQMEAEMRKRPAALAKAAELRSLQDLKLIQIVKKGTPAPKGTMAWRGIRQGEGKSSSILFQDLFRVLGKEGDNINDVDAIIYPQVIEERLGQILPQGRGNIFLRNADARRRGTILYDSLKAAEHSFKAATTVHKMMNTVLSGLPGNPFQIGNALGAGQLAYLAHGIEAADPQQALLATKAALLARGFGKEGLKGVQVPMASGKSVALEDVVKAGMEDGALGQGVLRYGGEHTPTTALGRMTQTAAKYTGNQAVNDVIEDWQHGWHYVRAIQKYGLEPAGRAKAMAETAKYSGLYRRLSPLERGLIREIVPFYAWTKVFTEIVARTTVQNPERLQAFKLLKDAADRKWGTETESMYEEPMSSTGVSPFQAYPTPIRMPASMQPRDKEGQLTGTRLIGNPQTPLDAYSLLNPSGAAGRINPLIVYTFETAFGADMKRRDEQLIKAMLGKGGRGVVALANELLNDGYIPEAEQVMINALIGGWSGAPGMAIKSMSEVMGWDVPVVKDMIIAPGMYPSELNPAKNQAWNASDWLKNIMPLYMNEEQ